MFATYAARVKRGRPNVPVTTLTALSLSGQSHRERTPVPGPGWSLERVRLRVPERHHRRRVGPGSSCASRTDPGASGRLVVLPALPSPQPRTTPSRHGDRGLARTRDVTPHRPVPSEPYLRRLSGMMVIPGGCRNQLPSFQSSWARRAYPPWTKRPTSSVPDTPPPWSGSSTSPPRDAAPPRRWP